MIDLRKSCFVGLCGLMLFSACKNEEPEANNTPNEASAYIYEIKQNYAPDKRVAIFDIESRKSNGKFILKGESNLPEAVAALKNTLQSEELSFIDSIQMLP